MEETIMKKLVRILALSLVAVMLCAALAACAKVSGAYSAEIDLWLAKGTATYDFVSASKVTLTLKGELLGQVSTKSYEGKYEITENSDGTMSITFTFTDENDDTKSYGGTKTFAMDKEKGTVTIAGITYTKAE